MNLECDNYIIEKLCLSNRIWSMPWFTLNNEIVVAIRAIMVNFSKLHFTNKETKMHSDGKDDGQK